MVSNVIQIKKKFYTAEDICSILDVSISTAYRIIRDLNSELSGQGKITIRGKVSIRYFNDKVYL